MLQSISTVSLWSPKCVGVIWNWVHKVFPGHTGPILKYSRRKVLVLFQVHCYTDPRVFDPSLQGEVNHAEMYIQYVADPTEVVRKM